MTQKFYLPQLQRTGTGEATILLHENPVKCKILQATCGNADSPCLSEKWHGHTASSYLNQIRQMPILQKAAGLRRSSVFKYLQLPHKLLDYPTRQFCAILPWFFPIPCNQPSNRHTWNYGGTVKEWLTVIGIGEAVDHMESFIEDGQEEEQPPPCSHFPATSHPPKVKNLHLPPPFSLPLYLSTPILKTGPLLCTCSLAAAWTWTLVYVTRNSLFPFPACGIRLMTQFK